MIYFTNEEAQMLKHTAETMGDQIRDGDGYTEADEAAVDKIEAMGKVGRLLVITDARTTDAEAVALFQQVIAAELVNWVPGASQRLVHRAGSALGFLGYFGPPRDVADCGPQPMDHALMNSELAGVTVHLCGKCDRLFAR